MARGLLVLAALAAAASASAEMRVVSATGRLTSRGKALHPGDRVPPAKLELSSGTAVFDTDAGRFLLKGPAAMTPARSSIRLDLGGLLSVLPKLGRRRFAVRTTTAVAAIRGTDFFVDARGENESYVCVCRGEAGLSAEGLEARKVAADHHKATLFRRAEAGVEASDAGMESHTDEELEELRSAIEP